MVACPIVVDKSDYITFETDSLVIVIVGTEPDQKQFSVHEPMLVIRSKFFQAALSEHWAESESRIIKLEDVDPEVFRNYLNLVYRGRLPVSVPGSSPKGIDKVKEDVLAVSNQMWESLVDIYLLAERILDRSAKNQIVSVLFEGNDLLYLHSSIIANFTTRPRPEISAASCW
ncbi:hypothetical protein M011DRAFT_47949 [Sporormia fimetaria CBS 119925]|uniref:BTB domain-containing protein n=1 Tax=Sporormia fimetaria CBS 119925 TaxID=1340428 RepID=A0A6A6VEH6_9PLEO|nr:hypothetical protein M011DRAFT_47949 [Sporormia fimetaria CBS 119925]